MKLKNKIRTDWILMVAISLCFCSSNMAQTSMQRPQVIEDVNYTDKSKETSRTLDLYLPQKAAKPVPLIVFIHGGGWIAGDKRPAPYEWFVAHGYAFASINYRLTNEAIFPAQINDAKCAIRYLRAHAQQYNINPGRIGVWGGSAGAHLAALLGTSAGVKQLEGDGGSPQSSSAVQAVCDWSGPANLLTCTAQAGPDNQAHLKDPDGMLAKLLGGLPSQKMGLAKAASPVTYVTKDAPPFLIMHGDKDELVPIEQSRELNDKLRVNHVSSQLVVIPGGKHSFGSPNSVKQVFEFFEKNLR